MSKEITVKIDFSEFVKLIEETVRKVLNENKLDEQDRILSSEEVMTMFGISTTTLQTWRDKNKIPFSRIGNKIYYSQKEIMGKMTTSKGTSLKSRYDIKDLTISGFLDLHQETITSYLFNSLNSMDKDKRIVEVSFEYFTGFKLSSLSLWKEFVITRGF